MATNLPCKCLPVSPLSSVPHSTSRLCAPVRGFCDVSPSQFCLPSSLKILCSGHRPCHFSLSLFSPSNSVKCFLASHGSRDYCLSQFSVPSSWKIVCVSLGSRDFSVSRPGRDGRIVHWNSPECHRVSPDPSNFDFNLRRRFHNCKRSERSFGRQVSRKEVQFAPPDFDFRAKTREETIAVVSSSYPSLMDLVEDGTLVVVKRSEAYSERRTDGYREPETVFLVGTAHMSLSSAEQVERIVHTVKPENVVVELCRSRAGIMYEEDFSSVRGSADDGTQNLMSMSGQNFGEAISRSLRLGGRSALALRLLLGGLSQKVSKSAGVATGVEFRAARRAADAIASQLVLGDRPIEVTLQRAWEALKWDERFRLAGIFLQATMSSDLNASEETLQALKSDDALSAMFAEIGQRLPSLLQPLVYERDMYLAWSLKRSKAVNGCEKVVGVVGMGHMRGVVYNLIHSQDNLRFKDLVGTRDSQDKRSQGEKLFSNLLVETAIGGVLWLLWEQTVGNRP